MILQTQSHADVFRAAQVSRRWRNAANACDEFYMPLNLNLTIDTLMVLPRDLGDIAECASRIMSSTPVPIQLRIKITTIPSTIPPNSAIQRKFKEFIVQALPRVVDLSVESDRTEMLRATVLALTNQEACRLRDLRLWGSKVTVQVTELPVGFLSGGAPKLHTLRLCSFDVSPGPVAAFAAVRRLDLIFSPAPVSDILCGHFPHLQYLSLENVTPVVAQGAHARRVAVPGLRTLVNWDRADDYLKNIEFSNLDTLLVAGAEDVALFLPPRATELHLELRIPHAEYYPLILECAMDKIAYLTTKSSAASPQSATYQQRTFTFGLMVDPDTDGLADLNLFRSIARDLVLVDMDHTNLCQFLSLQAVFPKLETLRSNFHASYYEDDFFPLDATSGGCPALQLLNVYSITSPSAASGSGSWCIPGYQLINMCAEMELFDREADDRPELLIQGLEIDYDEDSDDEAINLSDAFKSINVEVRVIFSLLLSESFTLLSGEMSEVNNT